MRRSPGAVRFREKERTMAIVGHELMWGEVEHACLSFLRRHSRYPALRALLEARERWCICVWAKDAQGEYHCSGCLGGRCICKCRDTVPEFRFAKGT